MSGKIDDVLPLPVEVQQIRHAPEIRLEDGTMTPADVEATPGEEYVLEAADDGARRLEDRRLSLGVDVDAVDVLRPVYGAKESFELLHVAVHYEGVGEWKGGLLGGDGPPEVPPVDEEMSAVGGEVTDVGIGSRRACDGGSTSMFGGVACEQPCAVGGRCAKSRNVVEDGGGRIAPPPPQLVWIFVAGRRRWRRRL